MKATIHLGCRVRVGASTILGILASAAWLAPTTASAQACPNPPPPTITSPQVPTDVCIPAGFPSDENPIQFFDDYSWRAFIAMVWPAQNGQRGVPDSSRKVGDTSGPLVFESFKVDWEVFQPGGNAPAAWSAFGGVSVFPCQGQVPNPGFNDLILAAVSKFEDLGQAGFGNLVGPLVAQNGSYVRYLTSFNEMEFNQILQNKWYVRANLPSGGLTFQNGALDLKTSWVDMTNVPNPERFYTRQAWLMDLATETCSQKTVGLVGMHIVQKTPSRPQWIWSTFEHVDNDPPPSPGHTGPFTFNNGAGNPMPASNPIPFPPPATPPGPPTAPFNVQRVTPIHPSTQNTNAGYRNALQGTVWANYQLVMTQWPIQANQPSLPGTPANTFPGTLGAATSFANTTMETFDQKNIVTGCMNCHNLAKSRTDFLWSLQINAYPPTLSVVTPAGPAVPASRMVRFVTPTSEPLQQLKALMQSQQ